MSYPSDLNDTEWRIIEPFLSLKQSVESPREVDLRAVVNAIFCRADNGTKWQAMPVDTFS
jgi:transposase